MSEAGVVREAGAIVVRRVGDELRVLVLTPKNDPDRWIFPKGHIEPGERAPDAAIREAHEEAGVRARVLAPAGRIAFVQAGAPIDVELFLMLTTDAGRPEPGRALAWLSLDAALERLTFGDARSALRAAWTVLQRDHPELFLSDAGSSDRK